MDFRVQGFDAAIHHFGKAGVSAEVSDFDALLPQGFGGAAGGNDFDARPGQNVGKSGQAGFVENRKQRALNFYHHPQFEIVADGIQMKFAANGGLSGCNWGGLNLFCWQCIR